MTGRDAITRGLAMAPHGHTLTGDLVDAIATDPETRLTMLLVRCGGGRFLTPAQDVKHFIGIIEQNQRGSRDAALANIEGIETCDGYTRFEYANASWIGPRLSSVKDFVSSLTETDYIRDVSLPSRFQIEPGPQAKPIAHSLVTKKPTIVEGNR